MLITDDVPVVPVDVPVVPAVPVVPDLPDLSRMTKEELCELISVLQYYAKELDEQMINAARIISPRSVRAVNKVKDTANMFKEQIAEIVQSLSYVIALIIKAFTPHHILVPVGFLFVRGSIELWLHRIDATKNKFNALLNTIKDNDVIPVDIVVELQYTLKMYILKYEQDMLHVTQYKLLYEKK